MKKHLSVLSGALLAGALFSSSAFAAERTYAEPEQVSKAQQVLDQAATDEKYTFILFYRDDSQAARTMSQTIKTAIAQRKDQAVLTYVQITDPAEKALVARFGVGRAAMPMSMAVAPNGAITAILPPKFDEQNIENAFVTPTMMRAMKSLQEGKLVLVSVHGSRDNVVPVAVKQFQADPHFKDRVANVSLSAADPAETKFMNQMQIDSRSAATTTVLLAPPGMMVGKFDATATSDDIAAALAQAGKCCNDPNCKHNARQSSSNARPSTQPSQQRR